MGTCDFQIKSKTTFNHLAFGLKLEGLGSRAAVTDTVYTNIKSKKESQLPLQKHHSTLIF